MAAQKFGMFGRGGGPGSSSESTGPAILVFREVDIDGLAIDSIQTPRAF